jgi:hypothetical protein
MDPVANMREQCKLARKIILYVDQGLRPLADDANELAELVITLDEWRRKGGFDPYNPSMQRRALNAESKLTMADEIREALEGDSNDAEHDALVSIAETFGINWTSHYDNAIQCGGCLRTGHVIDDCPYHKEV